MIAPTERGLQLAPKDRALRLELARAHIDQGAGSAATRLLDTLGKEPGPHEALYHVSRARLLESNDPELAVQIRAGLSALQARKTHLSALLEHLVRAFKHHPAARQLLEDYCDQVPDDWEAGLALATGLFNAGDRTACLASLDRLIERCDVGFVSAVRFLRVEALAALGRPETESEIRRYLEDFPYHTKLAKLAPYIRMLR